MNRVISGLLIGAGLLFATLLAIYYFRQGETYSLKIGAGSSSGDAYQFARAIEVIVERHHPEIQIEIVETKGTAENLELLDKRELDLAMVQADVDAVSSARIVSRLYPDFFQLVVREESDINDFTDLRNKKIALPTKGGGQWISFWFVAEHFGLEEDDIDYITPGSEEARRMMIEGEVDAVFRVRAAPHDVIADIIKAHPCKLISIEQGAAMRLKQPALDAAYMPKGAYQGSPAVPDIDILTVAVDRLLVAHESASQYAVKEITRTLYERRRELLEITALAGFIQQPNREKGTFIPLHKGAQQFYDREKPPYYVENADFFALILSMFLVLLSSVAGLRSFFLSRQKNKADTYAKKLVQLTAEVRQSQDISFVQEKKNEILQIFAQVIDDLDHDRVNPEGFNFFSFTWNVAFSIIQEKENQLSMAR